MKIKQMSVNQRITELKSLIVDSVALGFTNYLIMGYQQQLTTLQEEIIKDNEKRNKAIRLNKKMIRSE